MKIFRFEKAEHPEFGSEGWRMVGTDMDPLGGMGVAHDCLEHFGEDHVTLTSELQALGASLFTRAGYFSARGKFETDAGIQMCPDIRDILFYAIQGQSIKTPPRTREIEDESSISAMFAKLPEWLDDRSSSPKERRMLKAYYPEVRGWLRVGYRRAIRRYQGHSSWDVTHLFMQIEDEADRFLKMADSYEQLVVKVNFRDLTGSILLEEMPPEY